MTSSRITSPEGLRRTWTAFVSPNRLLKIAQYFLICADQKRADVIVAAVVVVQRKGALHIAAVDKLIDFAIRIAGDITQHRIASRFLLQTVDRHDREQLFDGPAVGHALEQREV